MTYGSSVSVTKQTTVAATSQAGVGAGVGGEVAVAATPDTTSLPVVGNVEADSGVRSSLPTEMELD